MSKKDTQVPDNSPAIISMSQQGGMTQRHASDNQFLLGMAQTGAQIMQSQGAFMLGNAQINAQTEISTERNDTRLEIARLNHNLREAAQEDSHVEKMEELRVQEHRIEAEATQGDA